MYACACRHTNTQPHLFSDDYVSRKMWIFLTFINYLKYTFLEVALLAGFKDLWEIYMVSSMYTWNTWIKNLIIFPCLSVFWDRHLSQLRTFYYGSWQTNKREQHTNILQLLFTLGEKVSYLWNANFFKRNLFQEIKKASCLIDKNAPPSKYSFFSQLNDRGWVSESAYWLRQIGFSLHLYFTY